MDSILLTMPMAAIASFSTRDARFNIVHVDQVGPLPPRIYVSLYVCGSLYQMARTISLTSTSAELVAKAFLLGWIA